MGGPLRRAPYIPPSREDPMRKLELDPEQLSVESCTTAELDELYGTVRGAQDGVDELEELEVAEPGDLELAPASWWSCFTRCGQLTCGWSCAGSCAGDVTCNSCNGTCP